MKPSSRLWSRPVVWQITYHPVYHFIPNQDNNVGYMLPLQVEMLIGNHWSLVLNVMCGYQTESRFVPLLGNLFCCFDGNNWSISVFPVPSRQCPEDSILALYSGWNYKINLFGISFWWYVFFFSSPFNTDNYIFNSCITQSHWNPIDSHRFNNFVAIYNTNLCLHCDSLKQSLIFYRLFKLVRCGKDNTSTKKPVH